MSLPAVDLIVILLYIAGVTAWGAWLGRGETDARDYFFGNRELPWGAVLLSVVATETSTLTFLSIPGISYLGTLGFLQLAFGYLIGRVVVAALLLPRYYRRDLTTAYEFLDLRFGPGPRRATSAIFMITRLLADSVRLFATAIPLALITGWPYPASIAAIGVATLLYTYVGGIRAVVWVDVAQMVLYLTGGLAALAVLQVLVPGGWGAVVQSAADAGKLSAIDLSFDLSNPYTLWAGIFGGAFLTMGSHGTDQLIVQRLLTCRDLTAARRALVGSGFVVIFQFALFLAVGLGLWFYYEGRPFDRSDAIFATFIVDEMPIGLRGLLIAGVLAAAMSSLSSSINSLASASAYDFWRPLRGSRSAGSLLRAGRVFTLLWAVLLISGAILFIPLSRGTAAVEVSLAIASWVYGGLLGAFALALFSKRAVAPGVIVGIVIGIGAVTLIWLFAREFVAWPWFVLIGTAVTYAAGEAISRAFGGDPADPSGS